MDSEPEYHPHSYFNFYPASGTNNSQQTENCDVPQSEQKDTLPKHTGGSKNAEQHLGTEQCTPKYPGTSQHFLKHPGTNRFSTQEIRRAHHKPPSPGANQHSALHPRNTQCFTPHLGQYQFGKTTHYKGTGKFPGPPLYTSYLGTAEYPRTSKQYVGRMLYDTGSQFPQMVTPLSDVHGTECTRENPSEDLLGSIGTSILGNVNSKVFGNASSEPQNFNPFQFTSTDVEGSHLERSQNNLPEKHRLKPVFANRELFRQDGKTAAKLEPNQGEQDQLTEETQAEERIDKSVCIEHLSKSYAKTRTLVALCHDFNTPVFGDLPGNEGEKIIMKNLARFLKDETDKIRFVYCREEQVKTTFENEDPIMQASLPEMEATISELEKKKRKLEGDKREFENVDKVVKGFTGELEENIKQVTTLKTEAEAHNVRLERLKERQKKERKGNELERSQFHKEMEVINKIHVHSLQENLRTLQDKIAKETNGFYDARRELKNLKERNDSLRTRIKEVETINNNFKRILAKSSKVGNTRAQNSSVTTHCNTD